MSRSHLNAPPSAPELQLRALRDALERAARSVENAEESTRQARAELHKERTKSTCFQFKIDELTHKLRESAGEGGSVGDLQKTIKELQDENKRLRTNIGELYRSREKDIETVKAELSSKTAAPLKLQSSNLTLAEQRDPGPMDEASVSFG